MDLPVVSRNSKSVGWSFFTPIPEIPTHLTLLRDHIATLANVSCKSHLRDSQEGVF